MNLLRAILADVIHFSISKREAEERMAELEELTRTYGGLAVVKTIQRRAKPDYATFLGQGKVQEIVNTSDEHRAQVLIVNEILKPKQLFHLEEILREKKMKVWDRVDLILHIFAKHAVSAEAKLQIELARLRHMGPRIFNLGERLGRQRGGTGTRGGSGEGNTEAMKRHLREQERRIVDRLRAYERQHNEQQKNRRRNDFKTVAIVGYTNAGKTSLLNALTRRKEYVANELFATLDTRLGELFVPEFNGRLLLADTIGFIQGLPPELIQAFRSTLSEALHADLILQVVDVSDPKMEEKIRVVEDILESLGLAQCPRVIAYNKADLLGLRAPLIASARYVSSITGEGLPELRQLLAQKTLETTPGLSAVS